MPNTFKSIIDRQTWVQVAPAPNAHAAGGSVCSDLRNDDSRDPHIYQLASATVLNRYNTITKGHGLYVNPTLGGTFGAGATCQFIPSFTLVGTTTTPATTTTVSLSGLTSSRVNQLGPDPYRGGKGKKIRIIDTVQGKTVERNIVTTTLGATPTIRVNSSFGFTPANNSRWEIASGRIAMLSAGTASFKIATTQGALSATASTTNLPATITTDSQMIVLDEQYVPYDNKPGEGMIKGGYVYDTNDGVSLYALTATASGASSLTGQAASGDAAVLANEYRNFQIRIVEDTVNTTAVGQRRIIASHTAGPSAVYTLGSAWSVTPSSSAKFVIELPNLLLLRTSVFSTTYTYNYADAGINNGTNTIAPDAWSSTYFGSTGVGANAGCMWIPSWGIQPDADKLSRHSYTYFFRGGGSSVMDMLDIAGGTTGAWTQTTVYETSNATLMGWGSGSCGCYCPTDNEGRFAYMNFYAASGVNQLYRFDVKNRFMIPYTPTDFIQSGTAANGCRLASVCAIDGSDKYSIVFLQSHLSTICQELIPLI